LRIQSGGPQGCWQPRPSTQTTPPNGSLDGDGDPRSRDLVSRIERDAVCWSLARWRGPSSSWNELVLTELSQPNRRDRVRKGSSNPPWWSWVVCSRTVVRR
jgi:hypothetical protein